MFLSSSGKEIKNHNRDSGSKNIVLKEINKQRRKEGRKAGRTPDRAVGSVPCSRGGLTEDCNVADGLGASGYEKCHRSRDDISFGDGTDKDVDDHYYSSSLFISDPFL